MSKINKDLRQKIADADKPKLGPLEYQQIGTNIMKVIRFVDVNLDQESISAFMKEHQRRVQMGGANPEKELVMISNALIDGARALKRFMKDTKTGSGDEKPHKYPSCSN
jgi:hypothetical protein